jgi:hypothetical protein
MEFLDNAEKHTSNVVFLAEISQKPEQKARNVFRNRLSGRRLFYPEIGPVLLFDGEKGVLYRFFHGGNGVFGKTVHVIFNAGRFVVYGFKKLENLHAKGGGKVLQGFRVGPFKTPFDLAEKIHGNIGRTGKFRLRQFPAAPEFSQISAQHGTNVFFFHDVV